MTFNILAFITIHVYLSSEKILAKSKIWAVDLWLSWHGMTHLLCVLESGKGKKQSARVVRTVSIVFVRVRLQQNQVNHEHSWQKYWENTAELSQSSIKAFKLMFVYLFVSSSNLEKCSIASLVQQLILCSEWVPSEWESKQLIKTSQ